MKTINDKIKSMFEMQDALNKYTAGDDYAKGYNHKDMRLNYCRFAAYECIEMANSFNFKTWKDLKSLDEFNMPNDIDNVKVELVDVWHFLMSSMLVENEVSGIDPGQFIEIMVNEFEYNSKVNDKFVLPVVDLLSGYLLKLSYAFDSKMMYLKLGRVEDEEFDSRLSNDLQLDDITSYRDIYLNTMSKAVKVFVDLVKVYFNDYSEFIYLYSCKCGLNLFRQQNGYADGTYVKSWNIEHNNRVVNEDNEALYGYEGDLDKDSILNYLNNLYKEVKK